tara:strand:- start:212 stop:655 length:444 start_codon:yes stop_codon:yes gene_type:complete
MTEVSIFSRKIDPFYQALSVFLGSLFFVFLFRIIEWVGIAEAKDYLPWTMSAAGLLFFAILNSILSLAYENQNLYWLKSIVAFILLVVIGGLVSYLISGLSLNEAMSFRWLYIVFSVGYIVFLTIVRLMRKIVLIAKKQDKALRGEE